MQFTDTSVAAASWAWSFTNNGTVDSTSQNPIHVYAVPGNYSVNLTVTNANGSDTLVRTNYITVNVPPTVYSTNVTSSSCSALVYPNELDQPAPAQIQYNFTVDVSPNFSNESYSTVIQHNPDASIAGNCSYSGNSTERLYMCNATMNYYRTPGSYNVLVNYTSNNLSVNYTNAGICSYGQLMALQKNTPSLSFPGAGPGIDNVQSSAALTVYNTGNVNFTAFLTGYDLTGRTFPGYPLVVTAFKAGVTLNTSIQLSNGVQKNITAVPYGLSSSKSIYLWLSMPVSTVPQDYYSLVPWQIGGTP